MTNEPIEILERDLDDLIAEATQGAAADSQAPKSVTQRLDGVLAPVLAKKLQEAIQELNSIKRMCGMINEGEWADHGAQGPLAQLTEATFSMLVGEANAAKRDAVDAARWRFTRAFAVRPDLVARLEQFYGEVDVIQARPRDTEQAYDQATDDLMALAVREGAWSQTARHSQAEQHEAQAVQAGDEPSVAAFETHWYSQKSTAIGSTEAKRHFDAGWKARPTQATAIKLPPRCPSGQEDDFRRGCAQGFNACLIAVSQLNAVPGADHE